MATQAIEIPESEMQHYHTAAEQFLADVVRKHPGLVITQGLLDAVVSELREMNLFRQSISVKSFQAGFLSAVASGKITLPKPPPVTEMAAKLVAKFPPVVKRYEGNVAEKLGNAGVAAATGRMTKQDREESNRKIEDKYKSEREMRNAKSLRAEFQRALNDAGMLTGRTHSESNSLRKEATAAVMADPKFLSVRDKA